MNENVDVDVQLENFSEDMRLVEDMGNDRTSLKRIKQFSCSSEFLKKGS